MNIGNIKLNNIQVSPTLSRKNVRKSKTTPQLSHMSEKKTHLYIASFHVQKVRFSCFITKWLQEPSNGW